MLAVTLFQLLTSLGDDSDSELEIVDAAAPLNQISVRAPDGITESLDMVEYKDACSFVSKGRVMDQLQFKYCHKITKRELRVLAKYIHHGVINIPFRLNFTGDHLISTVEEAKEFFTLLEAGHGRMKHLWKLYNDAARVRPQEIKERPTNQETADACKQAFHAAYASLPKGKGKGLGQGKQSGKEVPTTASASLGSVSVSSPASTPEPQASQHVVERPPQESLHFGLVGYTIEQIFNAVFLRDGLRHAVCAVFLEDLISRVSMDMAAVKHAGTEGAAECLLHFGNFKLPESEYVAYPKYFDLSLKGIGGIMDNLYEKANNDFISRGEKHFFKELPWKSENANVVSEWFRLCVSA